jgi:hypothetical protein
VGGGGDEVDAAEFLQGAGAGAGGELGEFGEAFEGDGDKGVGWFDQCDEEEEELGGVRGELGDGGGRREHGFSFISLQYVRVLLCAAGGRKGRGKLGLRGAEGDRAETCGCRGERLFTARAGRG